MDSKVEDEGDLISEDVADLLAVVEAAEVL